MISPFKFPMNEFSEIDQCSGLICNIETNMFRWGMDLEIASKTRWRYPLLHSILKLWLLQSASCVPNPTGGIWKHRWSLQTSLPSGCFLALFCRWESSKGLGKLLEVRRLVSDTGRIPSPAQTWKPQFLYYMVLPPSFKANCWS